MLGPAAQAVTIDVSSESADAVPARWHRRAGEQRRHLGAQHDAMGVPVEDWRRVLDVNLTGVFLCCWAVVPHMVASGQGRFVNVASVAGKEANPNAPAYSASKAEVIGLTKSLGKELARARVVVNCVTPAAVRTAVFDQMSEEHVQLMLSKIPMGASARSRGWRRSWDGCARRSARSRPAPCSTSPEDGRPAKRGSAQPISGESPIVPPPRKPVQLCQQSRGQVHPTACCRARLR